MVKQAYRGIDKAYAYRFKVLFAAQLHHSLNKKSIHVIYMVSNSTVVTMQQPKSYVYHILAMQSGDMRQFDTIAVTLDVTRGH